MEHFSFEPKPHEEAQSADHTIVEHEKRFVPDAEDIDREAQRIWEARYDK